MDKKLLAIDVGNTNITLGVFKGKKLISRWKISSVCQAEVLTSKLRRSFRKYKISSAGIEAVIVVSVVPELSRRLKFELSRFFGKTKIFFVGKDLWVPMKNLYRQPEQVGQDRLVGAYAAFKEYGAPLIVVDFGTAVTFDLVAQKGEYLGGLIVPGINLSLRALSRQAALLPYIKLNQPKELIGQDTVSSMVSGIIYGFASLTDGLIQKLKKRFKKSPPVIATGGDAPLIKPYSKFIHKIDNNLTLKGIFYTYNQ